MLFRLLSGALMSPHPFLPLLSLITGTGSDRDLVAFVLRNTPGANVDPDDIRTVQAAMAWWRRFGGESPFEAYLEAIPTAPDFEALRKEFPMLDLPLLVDPRLGHVCTARLVGLNYGEYGNTDMTLEPADTRHAMPTDVPYWVLAHDGTPNLSRRPPDCLAGCTGPFLAGIADVLMAIRLQYGPRAHAMDGPGSVLAGDRGRCACVNPFAVKPHLHAIRLPRADPDCGAVVFVQGVKDLGTCDLKLPVP